MQSTVDATCRDCGIVIRWDTATPRLCDYCLETLHTQSTTPKVKAHDNTEEVLS